MGQTSQAFYFDDFELRNKELYCKGKSKSLTTGERKLRLVGTIAEILGKEGLRELGFDIPRGKITAQQAVVLNRVELPSMFDIAKADHTELQQIMGRISSSNSRNRRIYPCADS